MKAIDVSVHDVWTDDDLLVNTILRRIDDCGRYSPYNPEWQSLSTMMDYALKTKLAKNEKASLITDKLGKTGYHPLNRISSSPSIKLGRLDASEDGVIGINKNEWVNDAGWGSLMHDSCLDVFLTGCCTPIFSVFLQGDPRDPIYAISPDSKKLAILHGDRLAVWGLADCRILLEKPVPDPNGALRIAWSRNSEKILMYGGSCFLTVEYDTGNEEMVCHTGADGIQQLITNDDASEFVYHDGEHIFFAFRDTNLLLSEGIEFGSCYLVRSRGEYWALLDGSAYLVKDGSLEYRTDLDESVDTDPRRFEEIISEQITDNHYFENFSSGGCSAEVCGDEVVFRTIPRITRTHCLVISADTLDYEKYVEDTEDDPTPISSFGRESEIGEGIGYRVEPRRKDASANLFVNVDGTEHHLGPCRNNAVAAYAKGKIFVYRGKTVEVYDRESMALLKSILAMDTDRWIICGTDSERLELERLVAVVDRNLSARGFRDRDPAIEPTRDVTLPNGVEVQSDSSGRLWSDFPRMVLRLAPKESTYPKNR